MSRLENVFREVFDDTGISITQATTAENIEQWDSLTHIELIVAAEKEFNIRFSSMDLKKLENVGDLANLISKKLS